jgi:uncharacterized membrane protein
MTVLFVLFGSWILFRAVGVLGVSALSSWQGSGCFALAAMFLFTGIAHFTKVGHEMARMVPRMFARPMLMVYFTGVCELLGAIGLVLPATRAMAGAALTLLLLVMFPANVKAARDRLTVGGRPATALWMRAPMQVLFIAMLWWTAMNNRG